MNLASLLKSMNLRSAYQTLAVLLGLLCLERSSEAAVPINPHEAQKGEELSERIQWPEEYQVRTCLRHPIQNNDSFLHI